MIKGWCLKNTTLFLFLINTYMTEKLPKKPESIFTQGICVKCGINKQSPKGDGKYRSVCSGCHRKRYGIPCSKPNRKGVYKGYKKGLVCNSCGGTFHHCQLDTDHIDGDRENKSPENLQTLCANCHRLKTFLNKEFMSKGYRP